MLRVKKHNTWPMRQGGRVGRNWAAWARRLNRRMRLAAGFRPWQAMVLRRRRLLALQDARRFIQVTHHHDNRLHLTLRLPGQRRSTFPAPAAASRLRLRTAKRAPRFAGRRRTTRPLSSAPAVRPRRVLVPARRRGLAAVPASRPVEKSRPMTVLARPPVPVLRAPAERTAQPKQSRRSHGFAWSESGLAPVPRVLRRSAAAQVLALATARLAQPAGQTIADPSAAFDAMAPRLATEGGRPTAAQQDATFDPAARFDVSQMTSAVMREMDRRFIARRERLGQV